MWCWLIIIVVKLDFLTRLEARGVAQGLVGGAVELITTVPPAKWQYEMVEGCYGVKGKESFVKGLMWGDHLSLFNM